MSVSFDGGEPQEVVRYDSSTVTDDYDGSTINAHETHTIDVPAHGADNAVNEEIRSVTIPNPLVK